MSPAARCCWPSTLPSSSARKTCTVAAVATGVSTRTHLPAAVGASLGSAPAFGNCKCDVTRCRAHAGSGHSAGPTAVGEDAGRTAAAASLHEWCGSSGRGRSARERSEDVAPPGYPDCPPVTRYGHAVRSRGTVTRPPRGTSEPHPRVHLLPAQGACAAPCTQRSRIAVARGRRAACTALGSSARSRRLGECLCTSAPISRSVLACECG